MAGFIDLSALELIACYQMNARGMTLMGVQVLGAILNKCVSTADNKWGHRWSDIPKSLEEFHRILFSGGILKITTPHFSCANSVVDPTHKWHLSYFSFDYFSDSHSLSYYSQARYKIKTRHIQFQGGRINRSIISRLANRFPKIYEQRWAWIFPAWFLYFELEAIK